MICPRCGRQHSGICGIPSIGIRIGIGGTGIRRQETTSNRFPIHTKPSSRIKLTKHGLEEMLDWGIEQEKKCMNMLKVLPSEMKEYNQILERLDKVWEVNAQIKKQILAKKRS